MEYPAPGPGRAKLLLAVSAVMLGILECWRWGSEFYYFPDWSYPYMPELALSALALTLLALLQIALGFVLLANCMLPAEVNSLAAVLHRLPMESEFVPPAGVTEPSAAELQGYFELRLESALRGSDAGGCGQRQA